MENKNLNEELNENLETKQEDILEAEEITSEKPESLEEKIIKIETEVEEWKSAYLRKQAEFQNFTKRKEKELEELRKFAAEKVIVKVLEAVDNLERGVSASTETKDFDSLVQGVNMTLNQMHGIMNAEGVEAIETNGKEFDPNFHMAVMAEPSEDHEDNHIIMELQKGYIMKGKVIRPSMVKVCKK